MPDESDEAEGAAAESTAVGAESEVVPVVDGGPSEYVVAAARVENAAVSIAVQWGWYVFPVRVHRDGRTGKRSKIPAVPRWNTPGIGCWNTEAEIREAFSKERGAKIGIACGPSGIVVLDQDRELDPAEITAEWNEALDVSRTLVLKSQSWSESMPWRRHFIYSVGTGPGYRSGAVPIGDIKGVGGFVVLGMGRVDGSNTILGPPPTAIAGWAARPGSIGSAEPVSDHDLDVALMGTSLYDGLLGSGSGEQYLKVQETVTNRLDDMYARWGSRDHAVYRTMCSEVVTCMAGGYPLSMLLDWCLDWLAGHTFDANGLSDPMTEDDARAKLKRALGWVTEEAVDEMRRERFFDLDVSEMFDWDSTLVHVETDPDGMVLDAAEAVVRDALDSMPVGGGDDSSSGGSGGSGFGGPLPSWAEAVELPAAVPAAPVLPAAPLPPASDNGSVSSNGHAPSVVEVGPPGAGAAEAKFVESSSDPDSSSSTGSEEDGSSASTEGGSTSWLPPDAPPLDPGALGPGAPPDVDADAELIDKLAARKILDMRALKVARGVITEETAEEGWEKIANVLDMRMGTEMLADVIPDEVWSIDGFLQAGQTLLLSASPKAGKTRMAINILRTFVEGAPFLGAMASRPGGLAGTTAYLQADMAFGQFKKWVLEQGISKVGTDRMWLVDMQGRTDGFDVRSPEMRANWADMFRAHGCEGGALIIDVLQSVTAGLGLEETNSDLGALLEGIVALKVDVGFEHVVVIHHHGHGSERARGGSVLLGKFDVVADLVLPGRGQDDMTGAGTGGHADGGTSALSGSSRYFKAYGRGVELPESKLSYDPDTGRMTVAMAVSRAAARMRSKGAAVVDSIMDVLGPVEVETADPTSGEITVTVEWPALSKREFRDRVTGSSTLIDQMLDELVADGLVERASAATGRRGTPALEIRLTEAGRERAAGYALAADNPDLFTDDGT